MSCLIWRRARGTTTHIQVKKFVLADFFDIYCVAQQFYSIYPASEYRTFCPAIELSPVVHRGLSAAGQLVTLVYWGKINDLTLWLGYIIVFLEQYTFTKQLWITHFKEMSDKNSNKTSDDITLMVLSEPLNTMFLVATSVHTGLSWATRILSLAKSCSMSHTYNTSHMTTTHIIHLHHKSNDYNTHHTPTSQIE